MGTVYRAVHVTKGYHVALKVLPPQVAQDAGFVKRFLRETEVLRRLRHRHIVQLYEAGHAQGTLYMAMEYAQGGSLAQRLSGGRPLDPHTATGILRQIASALDHAHRQGVIHRDVKPSNILFAGDGRAMLADFGIATAVGLTRLTQTGAVIGTPEYVSPEQAEGSRQLDYRTDIYSLGVVAYQMLTGRVPFQRENTWATMLAHIRETPPPLRHWNRSISSSVQAAVLRALDKSPNRRYASAGQFVQALAAAASGARLPRTPTPRPQGRTQLGTRVIWLIVALALVGVIAGVLSWRPDDVIDGPSVPPASGPLIAFESDEDGNKEIYAAQPTGGSRWRLTHHAAMDWAPAWDPDGQRLAFVSDRDGFMDIYVVSRQGGGVRNLTQSPAQDSGPAWSPDGQRIAFDSDRDRNLEIYVVNVDGTGLTNLSRHSAHDGDPGWSSDGQWIAFETNRDGNFEIYIMPATGGMALRRTTNSWRDFAPVWSPDGQRIVFECQRETGPEICVMNGDGSEMRRLTTDHVRDQQPSWSPDGRQIIWTRQNPLTGAWDLYVMNADGQDVPFPLLTSTWSETAPVWTR
jgi:Tol biopolymer transport system component